MPRKNVSPRDFVNPTLAAWEFVADSDGPVIRIVQQGAGGTLEVGAGDIQSLYVATAGKTLSLSLGSAAAPDAGLGPTLKVTRRVEQVAAALTGDGAEQMASILGITVGTANNVGQVIGTLGAATSAATNGVAQAGGGDAAGGYFVGRITGSGTGTGIGAFIAGRRDTNTGRANALELSTQNYTGSAGVYNSSGFSDTTGLWLEATGNSDSAVGISFGNPFGFQYDVGIAFPAQVNNAKTGGIKTSSIRDDGNAATSILINGTHATAAIAVAATAGQVLIGGVTNVFAVANNVLEVQGSNNTVDGLVAIGSVANQKSYAVRIRNSAGQARFGIIGGAGDFLTGTAVGDAIIGTTSASKFLHIGGTISTIKVGTDNTLGFFNGATAAKQTVTGAKGSNAALGSLIAALVAHNLITDTTSA